MPDFQWDTWGYLVAWEFQVRAGQESQFEKAYGPDGAWARLFRQGKGYLGTQLARNSDHPRRYVTLDFWDSPDSYTAFKQQHSAEYKAMDEGCEAFTESERELATLTRVT